jgi:hypothetical protein
MQAPSKAPLWSACALAGSHLASHGVGYVSPYAEKAESDSRREGNAASWLAARLMRGHIVEPDAVGETAPNGWVITEDMLGHVMAFTEYMRSFGGAQYSHTTPVVLGDGAIIGHLEDNIAVVAGQTLHVFDLRYGWRIVEPERDPTLMCYGLGLANEMTARIVLHVYQPRPFHPDGPGRSWTIPATEATQWHDWLVHMANLGNSGNQAAHPGPQCRRHNCELQASCAALKASTYHNHERIAGRGVDRKMSPAELAAELDFLEHAEDVLKARKAGIEAEAEGRIRNREHVAGWEVVMRKGQRKFTVEADKVKQITGINPYVEKLCTPAELERRGANKEVVKTITDTPNIGQKLQRTDTKAFERMFRR